MQQITAILGTVRSKTSGAHINFLSALPTPASAVVLQLLSPHAHPVIPLSQLSDMVVVSSRASPYQTTSPPIKDATGGRLADPSLRNRYRVLWLDPAPHGPRQSYDR